MKEMDRVVLENHKLFLERMDVYRKNGYDIERERAFIIEKARPISGRILEAGTGKGYFTMALAREGFDFISFDISEEEQKFARLNLMYYGLEGHVQFHISDAGCLPYEDESFDVIFAINMVHHLDSADKVVEEFARVIAPSGKMILSDFNAKGLAMLDRIHAKEGRRHDVGRFNLNDVALLLGEQKFQTQWHYGDNQDVLIASK